MLPLDGLLKIYISTYAAIDNTLTIEDENPVAKLDNDIKDTVVSSYTSSVEIIGTCDRAYVINEGEIAGELNKDEITQERIMQCIMTHNRKGEN